MILSMLNAGSRINAGVGEELALKMPLGNMLKIFCSGPYTCTQAQCCPDHPHGR